MSRGFGGNWLLWYIIPKGNGDSNYREAVYGAGASFGAVSWWGIEDSNL